MKKNRTPEGYARQRAYTRAWQQANRSRIAARQRELRQELRLAALQQYGGIPPRCLCCHTDEIDHLTVVALDDAGVLVGSSFGGTQHYRQLRKAGYPPGNYVLCWNCLMSRSLYDVCPHEPHEYTPNPESSTEGRAVLQERSQDRPAHNRSQNARTARPRLATRAGHLSPVD